MENELLMQVTNWIYRNARQLELSLWQYFFENGTKEAVVEALMIYQNEDGGFGHALEADNWNPESTPITTNHAIKILMDIDFKEMEHPIYQGIWKYLNSEKDLLSYGFRFTVPGNDSFPHAPWWNYSEEQNEKEYYGVTAAFCTFIVQYGNESSAIYKKAITLINELIEKFTKDDNYGDMGLESYIVLIETLRELGFTSYNYELLTKLLGEKLKASIQHDTTKWAFYGVRPSNYIKDSKSQFYEENAEIVQKELEYLLKTREEYGVWNITWTWYQNMEQYNKYFYVSENWWKAFKAIENMKLLKNFGKL